MDDEWRHLRRVVVPDRGVVRHDDDEGGDPGRSVPATAAVWCGMLIVLVSCGVMCLRRCHLWRRQRLHELYYYALTEDEDDEKDDETDKVVVTSSSESSDDAEYVRRTLQCRTSGFDGPTRPRRLRRGAAAAVLETDDDEEPSTAATNTRAVRITVLQGSAGDPDVTTTTTIRGVLDKVDDDDDYSDAEDCYTGRSGGGR